MDLRIDADGVTLSGAEDGEGAPVVLLHGLTATRRYVVMGSRALERSGHRVIAYDARAHGKSDGAGDDYSYDAAGGRPARRARRPRDRPRGAGRRLDGRAHADGVRARAPRARRRARDHDPRLRPRGATRAWSAGTRSPNGLRTAASRGSSRPTATPKVPEKWHETIDRVLHQRLSAHEHPEALADALQAVPRSRPFEDWGELASHRRAHGRRRQPRRGRPRAPVRGRRALRARRSRAPGWSPRSEGASPLAWQGAQVSKVITEVADSAAAAP